MALQRTRLQRRPSNVSQRSPERPGGRWWAKDTEPPGAWVILVNAFTSLRLWLTISSTHLWGTYWRPTGNLQHVQNTVSLVRIPVIGHRPGDRLSFPGLLLPKSDGSGCHIYGRKSIAIVDTPSSPTYPQD